MARHVGQGVWNFGQWMEMVSPCFTNENAPCKYWYWAARARPLEEFLSPGLSLNSKATWNTHSRSESCARTRDTSWTAWMKPWLYPWSCGTFSGKEMKGVFFELLVYWFRFSSINDSCERTCNQLGASNCLKDCRCKMECFAPLLSFVLLLEMQGISGGRALSATNTPSS